MVLMGVFGYLRHDGTVSFAPRSAAIARRALSPFFGLFNLGGVTGSVVSALSRDYRGKLISPS